MHISQIRLKNFRCYEDVEIEFHPRFNIFVGINGTGKTSALEALRIAIGSLFLGVDKYKDKIASPGISQDDVRLSRLEQQYPVAISAKGVIEDFSANGVSRMVEIEWERSLTTKGGATRSGNAKEMKEVSVRMQEAIRRHGENQNIPLVAYYSTDRFKKEKKDVGVEPDGSRLRGYYNALDPLTNIKFFLDLYYTETLSSLQHDTPSAILQAVNEAVKKCVDCDDLMFDIKRQELLLVQHNMMHQSMPFHLLSDGVRAMLALVMEMAFRCYLLNPHLGKEAALLTSGVVLIDEIDLHLHPAWQKRVVEDLQVAFPHIQFIVTTHAPLVIGSLRDGKIFTIQDNQVYDFPLQVGKDANYILNEMGTSEMDDVIKHELNEYFLLIEKGQGKGQPALLLREQLEQHLGTNHTELQRADMMLSFF